MTEQANRITLVEGKLWKVVHSEGEGQHPSKGQQVHALYKGTLENGQQFDSNQNRDNPFKFTLGQGQVIKGWDEGFASMKRGERATLICSPEYAYGARGSPPRIPANSTLHFEVELLDFTDKKKQKWDLSIEEKVEEATKLKNEGNQFLKTNNLKAAVKKYNEGIEFVDAEDDESAKGILKILRMNASQAYLKQKNYSKVIEYCGKVLKEDPNNLKTLYRRGVAFLNNQDFDESKADLQNLLKIDPENNDAKQQLLRLNQLKRAAVEKEKNLMKGMFSKGGLYDDKKPKQKKSQKKKDETDSQKQQMPDLEKDEQKKEGTEQHHHHGEGCC